MINVLLNTQTRECVPDNTLLGFEEDNDSNKIAFRFADGFIDGLARLYIRKGDKKGHVSLAREGESYVLPVKKNLFIDTGVIEFQLTMYNGEDVVASYDSFGLIVKDKIITDEPLPEELPSWIDDYNAKILEVNEAIEKTKQVVNEMTAFELRDGNLYVLSNDEQKIEDYQIINGNLILTIGQEGM